MNELLKLTLFQTILIKQSFSEYSVSEMVYLSIYPASFSGSSALHVSAWWQKLLPLLSWSSVLNPMSSFFFSYKLLLSNVLARQQRLRLLTLVRCRRRLDRTILQAIQCSLFVRSRELGTSLWGLALQSSQCEPFLVLLKPERLVFNTKSLQLRFQKCARQLSVASPINSYWPACPVFREIGTDPNKYCSTTPNNKILRL